MSEPAIAVGSPAAGGSSARTWLLLASIVGFLGVLCGAFGAHGLKKLLEAGDPPQLANWETAVRYALVHAAALLGVAGLSHAAPSRAATAAGVAFALGVLLFSGSLGLYALLKARATPGAWVFAMITPFGGASLLIGWAALGLAGRALPKA